MTRKYWRAMLHDLKNTVVVFDLDDTLYPEADYVESGVRFICNKIQALYGLDIYGTVSMALEQDPKVDWLALACELTKLPSTAKESFLWMYRLHIPDIALSAPCQQALQTIRRDSKAVAILTDGRSVTQRLKLKALGLSDWPAYISEDHGTTKPSPERFRAIQVDYPAQHYVYLADNVQKDFIGCNPLGWIGVGMQGNHRNVHTQASDGLPASALPAHWVSSWEELTELLTS
jgi:putative hydrolase of the HAD superfamily